MTSITDKTAMEGIIEQFEAFENRLNGGASLPIHALRKKALADLTKSGLPTAKNEEYKYTNITKFFKANFGEHLNSEISNVSDDFLKSIRFKNLDAIELIFVNGHLSSIGDLGVDEDSLIIKELSSAMHENLDDFDGVFAKLASSEDDGYTALNTAFSGQGSFIKVKEGKTIARPIVLYFINDTSKGKIFSQPRNLFLVGKNAEVNIIESYHTIGEEAGFTNAVSEIAVAADARANYYKIEHDRKEAYHVGTTQVYQEKSSVFTAVTVTLGGAMIRNNLNIQIDAEHCEANMYGLTILHNNQHVDNHTVVDHMKPNSYSNELYKNILDDKSTGVFNGKIFVREDAQKTNAFQSNRNILLSDDASVNTKPQLEIWADDVKCSHGATTGQMDPEQLFYLRARGMSKESARAMLLYAFAKDVLENIKIEPIREELDRIINERLHSKISE